MYRTQGYPYAPGLARRLGEDRAARRARRRNGRTLSERARRRRAPR
jgi:hypothetical protein